MTIISLLRVVSEGAEQEELRVGLRYSLDNRQNYNGIPALTPERVREGLQKAVNKSDSEVAAPSKRSKKKPGDALRKALATSLNEFPPMLLDHSLKVAEFDSNTPVEDVLKSSSTMERLVSALGEAQKVIDNITRFESLRGYIISKPVKSIAGVTQYEKKDGETHSRENLMYEDFHPFRPQQFEDKPEVIILEFEGFNKTVDEFFSSIESQKLESRLTEREENAKRKLETARQDHEKRLGGLQLVQELNVQKAQAIEANFQKVQEVITSVNELLAQGMDWMDVARLIELEQERHNVVAEMIKLPLKLYENTATLLLAEADFDDEDDYDGNETGSDVSDSNEEQASLSKQSKAAKPADKRLAVDVDLALSPWSNARQYYDQKKSAAVKEQKTLQSSEKALKSTERKIGADLKKGLKQEKELMRPQRKALWFEKFIYFISSEGYLVLGGKDVQQGDILYKKYLKKGDVYIHADLHGAASIIVKNKSAMSDSPIPPSTLSQAGTIAVASSSAWDSKAVMSAWWVNADQVSKTAPTGEYLSSGGFTIRGHKNFLPPAQLVLGFGIMFRVNEESKARHLKHRIREEITARPVDATVVKGDSGLGQDRAGDDEDRPEEADSIDIYNADDLHGDLEGDSDEDGEENSDSESEHSNPLQPDCRPLDTLQSPEQIDEASTPDPGHGKASESNENGFEPDATLHEVDLFTYKGDQKRYLPTKECKLLGKDLLPAIERSQAPSNGTDLEKSSRPSNPATSTQSPIPSGQTGMKPQLHVRGKRGKRNKIKNKYANQDDEDRALAMRLLGSAAAQEKATEDTAAKFAKEQELAAQKERRRKQHASAAEKGKEAEEIRQTTFQEGIETLDDDELEVLDYLDEFVGAPLPGDEILDALVVCAPWDTIGGRCKWRVKLQPGTTKKGKAVREILGKWVGMVTDGEKKKGSRIGEGNEATIEDSVRSREGELIRAIREPEVVGVVPVGKLRVVMTPGDTDGKGRGSGGGPGKGKRGKGSRRQR